jgi:hypothetical protein
MKQLRTTSLKQTDKHMGKNHIMALILEDRDFARKKLGFSIGQYITVFQTKEYAIKSCVVRNTYSGYENLN